LKPIVPNTVRLVAEVRELWLRILGDDDRGYLMVGDLDLADVWFPRLELALDEAERAGVPRSAWGLDESPPHLISSRMRRRGGAR
jgi:hypothetical protein